MAFASYQMKKYMLLAFDPYSGKQSKKVASGGVARYHLDRMRFQEFEDGLTSHVWRMVSERRINSHHQEVFTVRVSKVFLQNVYLHRRLLKDSIHTLPWGYDFHAEET